MDMTPAVEAGLLVWFERRRAGRRGLAIGILIAVTACTGCNATPVPQELAREGQPSSSSRRSSAVMAEDSGAPSSTTRANRSRLRSCRATTFSSMVSRETIR